MKIVELPEFEILQALYEKLSKDPEKRLEQVEDLGMQIYRVNYRNWEEAQA